MRKMLGILENLLEFFFEIFRFYLHVTFMNV